MESNEFEKYEIIEIDRKDLLNAPYNPRKIKDDNKKRLKANIEKVGLIEPVVYNKRTGNIVSGHQRIAAIDSLHKSKDYKIRVAMIDVDEQTEKEQNIFMNNFLAQGEYDMEKLSELFLKEDIRYENAGLDKSDFYKLIGRSIDDASAEILIELSEDIKKNTALKEKIKAMASNKNETDFFLVFVFNSTKERNEVIEKYNLARDTFQKGDILQNMFETEGIK